MEFPSLIIVAGAAFGLAACGGQPKMETVCNVMVAGDAEIAEDMAGDGLTLADFCSCYDQQVGLTTDAVQDKHRAIFVAITELRDSNSVGIEAAADALTSQLRSSDNPHDFTEADFDAVGNFLNDIQDELDPGGACQAAGE